MRNTLTAIFLICSIIAITSCSKNNEYVESTLDGEWTTVERHVDIDHEFLSQSFKNLYALDDKDYIIKRVFNESDKGQGHLQIKALNRETGYEDRYRTADYHTVKDTLYIKDSEAAQTSSIFRLDGRVLITWTKLKKKDLDFIYREIGGDPNLIPDDAEATLIMREVK